MKKYKFFLFIASFILACSCYSQVCENDICENGENMENCVRDCWLDSIQFIKADAGRVDWSADGTKIAFDKKGSDGYYDVYTMNPDGTGMQCLTCGHPSLPQKHNGQPAWHPSGQWIIFQAEKQNHPGISYFSSPGRGRYNDLWVISPDGNEVHQLTNLPLSADSGALHPHFSNDGKKLSWSEMYKRAEIFHAGKEFGCWKLKVADFITDSSGVHLSNVQDFQPGDEVFYENHGFSPDNESLLFTTNLYDGMSTLTQNNIYTLHMSSGVLKKMTSIGYNEHASYSPDGSKIIYGSNRDNSNGMDYWIMNPDSGNKQRLTFFNKSGYPESLSGKTLAIDMSWNPNGQQIICYIQNGTLSDSGDVYKINLKSAPLGIHEVEKKNESYLKVNTNPASTELIYDLLLNKEATIKTEVMDILGKVVITELRKAEAGSNHFTIKTDRLHTGLYFLIVNNGTQRMQTEFIKE